MSVIAKQHLCSGRNKLILPIYGRRSAVFDGDVPLNATHPINCLFICIFLIFYIVDHKDRERLAKVKQEVHQTEVRCVTERAQAGWVN